jgi:hypothetical protein
MAGRLGGVCIDKFTAKQVDAYIEGVICSNIYIYMYIGSSMGRLGGACVGSVTCELRFVSVDLFQR